MKRTKMMALLAAGSLAFGMSAWAGGDGKCGGGDKFKSADTDGDGKLSKAEFSAVCKENADEKFAAADADKDGSLSADELKAGCGKGEGKCKGGDKKEA